MVRYPYPREYKKKADINRLCHANDPETSRKAAEKMVESGKLSDQEFEVYLAIKEHFLHTNFTAKELSKVSGINYYTIERRLSGIKNKGKIKRVHYKEYVSPETYVLRIDKRDGCCVWRLM